MSMGMLLKAWSQSKTDAEVMGVHISIVCIGSTNRANFGIFDFANMSLP